MAGLGPEGIFGRTEPPRQPKLCGELGREGTDGVDLGGIVPAQVEVEAALLRHVEPLLAQLARHEGVDAGLDERRDRAVAAPAAKGHLGGPGQPELDGDDPGIERLQPRAERRASQAPGRYPAYFAPLVRQEAPSGPQAQLAGE